MAPQQQQQQCTQHKGSNTANWQRAATFSSQEVVSSQTSSSSPRVLLQMGGLTSKHFINMTAATFNWHQSLLKLGSWELLITPEWLLLNLCSRVQGFSGVEVGWHTAEWWRRVGWKGVSVFLFCNKAASSVVTAIIMVVVVGESRGNLTGPPSTKGSSGVHQHTQLTLVEGTKRRISFNHQGYSRNNQQEHEAIDVGIQLHRCNVQGAICQSKWCAHLLSIIWFLQYL